MASSTAFPAVPTRATQLTMPISITTRMTSRTIATSAASWAAVVVDCTAPDVRMVLGRAVPAWTVWSSLVGPAMTAAGSPRSRETGAAATWWVSAASQNDDGGGFVGLNQLEAKNAGYSMWNTPLATPNTFLASSSCFIARTMSALGADNRSCNNLLRNLPIP